MVSTNTTTTLPFKTYSENFRVAAKAKGLNIRDLANRGGFSYEHIRKIWMGRTAKRKDAKFTISADCNEILCGLVGLPKDEMYALAEREKFAQKNGYTPVQLPDPMGQELTELWERLDDDQKQVLIRMGKSFAAEVVRSPLSVY